MQNTNASKLLKLLSQQYLLPDLERIFFFTDFVEILAQLHTSHFSVK